MTMDNETKTRIRTLQKTRASHLDKALMLKQKLSTYMKRCSRPNVKVFESVLHIFEDSCKGFRKCFMEQIDVVERCKDYVEIEDELIQYDKDDMELLTFQLHADSWLRKRSKKPSHRSKEHTESKETHDTKKKTKHHQ